jgi:transposase
MNRTILTALASVAVLAGLLPQTGEPAAEDTRPGAYPFVFTDVTESAGLLPDVANIWGHGAAWGDVDGDGCIDLYVATFHMPGSKPSLCFRNKKGKFEQDPQKSLAVSTRGTGVLFADFDNAGRLDLYLGNMPDPKNNHTGCVLLRNDGKGTFTDVSKDCGACPQDFGGRSATVLDYAAYGRLSPWCRQVCWAHLQRDFQKLVDRGGPSRRLGETLQRLAGRVFEQWHLCRGGGFDRAERQRRLDGTAAEFERVLQGGRRGADAKAATFGANVLERVPAVWRFVVSEGVAPTNNHAERLLRRGVLWRKSSFGCTSEAGCRLVERLLTVGQTRRLQGRSVLRYLYEALVAHRKGLPAPSLLTAQ